MAGAPDPTPLEVRQGACMNDLDNSSGPPADTDPPAPGMPRRVYLMIGQLAAGGAEKQVALLAMGLRQRGVEVTLLVMFPGGPFEAELIEAGVDLVCLKFGRRGGRGVPGRNLVAMAKMVRFLRRTRPDVLHAFLYHNYVIGAPAAWLARVPAMVAGRRSLGFFKEGRPLMLAMERVATRLTDLVVANAEAIAAETREKEGVPAEKVVVVRNGLPESAFVRAEPADLDTELPVVLSVANLRAVKGHRHLVEAAALLRDRGLPVTLVLAGDGPERDALRHQAAELGVDLRLLGVRRDIDRLLARADVMALPSLSEGMSNAVMEAMAAGTPVVATEVGGTPELLRGRGVLVPPGDSEALADGLGSILADPDHAARLAESAREWSRANLHVDTMVDRQLAIYADLLSRRRRSGAVAAPVVSGSA